MGKVYRDQGIRNIPGVAGIIRHILTMGILLTYTGTAQWDTQSPVPTHLDVRGVGAPSTQRVFIATDDNSFDNGGSLFESTDGGTTWVQRDIPISLGNPFNGIFFLDGQNGWVYGNENYKTTDGGTTWSELPFLGSTYFMKFYTGTFGLASGNFEHYVSYDAGNAWVPSPNNIFGFDFTDNLTGLGVSDSGVYRTTDGGSTLTLVQSGNAKAAVFLSGTIAVGIVEDGFVRSSNGGITWTAGPGAAGRTHLLAVSEDVVLAWGRTGVYPDYDDRILRSTDGGQSWNDLGEVVPAGVFTMVVIGSQTVIAADFNGTMYRSSDAGASWVMTFMSPGPSPSFLSSAVPVFADAQTGYFGYGNGFLIKTTDAGVSWFQVSSGTGESLNDIGRFPDGRLIAVGDNGAILTSNGVSPWILHTAVSQEHMKAVHVINASDVVVVDNTGQVFASTDGGITWSAFSARPSHLSSASDVHFTSLFDGWVIGQSSNTGALYHTTDGGGTWTPVTDFLGTYIAVDVEGSNIWAANVGGRFYRSTDNGATWIQENLPGSPHNIKDMDFFNESIGYVVGTWGEVYRSNDGGITWEALVIPNSNDNFTDIHLLGSNELWLSTSTGVAYYSANAGQNWAILDIESQGFGSFNSIVASPGGSAWVVGYQGYIEHFAGPPPPPLNRPPEASFNFSTTGLTVNFTDTSFDLDGFIVSWSWKFGDGATSTQQHPTHTFTEANTYIVRLTVTDDDGDSSTAGRIVVVQPTPGGTFGNFTEVTPIDSIFVTPQDEDFWVVTTAPADYDGDGDIDVAVLGYYVVYNQSVEDRLLLMRNNGLGGSNQWDFTYTSIPIGTLTTGSSDLAWGDVDGDGDLDLVVGTDGETVIYRNDAGSLVLTDTELPGYWEDNDQADFDLRSITWADFDNDGDLDLLLPSVFDDATFTYRTALMRNDGANGNGGWIFTEIDSVFAPTTHAQSFWADYDGDQDLDLLLINIAPLTDEGFIRRYRNEGNGVFTGEDVLGSLSVEHGEAQWGDFDGDGDLDILVAGNVKELDSTYTHMALRVYRNDAESYVPVNVIQCIPCEGWFDLTAATWADYDSDGDIDILLAGTYNSGSQIEGRAKIYANTGGIFTTDSSGALPAPRASGSRGGTFSWFDIDLDGDLDYFIAGQYFVPGGNGLVEAQMHLYRNDSPGQNSAPSGPAGLNAIVQGDSLVLLSWIPAFDDHTPSAALTYDLDLFRNGVPVAAPSRLPEPGSISAGTHWILYGLTNGHYEWRLRAVDAAYIGGPMVVGEFTIGVVSAGEIAAGLPKDYSLKQNYPNPFNPATVINYELPKGGFVSLKVFDLLGRAVATLVDGVLEAGSYSAHWDAANQASGVYIYRLQAGDFKQSKRMVLLR